MIDPSKGTVTGHYKQFLLNVMDVLDNNSLMSNSYLIMDNANSQKNPSISRIISYREYRILFLAPFFQELNQIEQFWHQLKSKAKEKIILPKKQFKQELQRLQIWQ
ncbi:uncharacterized protein CANTADRAFT_149038 [Suhomyces tanzawaensis NRRL Y-17324]|uniref:Tc1-like transposase DDE domain-containing protein n=1 Tax=Suhomyces tanzawaensis NRRL Y-17324 TaxID=984487 RepID=A0A1E4SB21_9ASCO|nr:uncharacterized protein CANTADRAFT_149038 [Suhomyces tanzawaensis NRRL Y-17324]ODV76675.1 hypothetical protein CANTADRAFT_149038 [Suhomyces tanzawaensis NRRL Y-17324]